MKSLLATVSGIALVVAYFAGLALHLFTCYIAYQVSFIHTALTFFLPFLAEIYWFFVLWSANGFWNIYTVAFLGVALLYAVAYGGLALAEEKESPEA